MSDRNVSQDANRTTTTVSLHDSKPMNIHGIGSGNKFDMSSNFPLYVEQSASIRKQACSLVGCAKSSAPAEREGRQLKTNRTHREMSWIGFFVNIRSFVGSEWAFCVHEATAAGRTVTMNHYFALHFASGFDGLILRSNE